VQLEDHGSSLLRLASCLRRPARQVSRLPSQGSVSVFEALVVLQLTEWGHWVCRQGRWCDQMALPTEARPMLCDCRYPQRSPRQTWPARGVAVAAAVDRAEIGGTCIVLWGPKPGTGKPRTDRLIQAHVNMSCLNQILDFRHEAVREAEQQLRGFHSCMASVVLELSCWCPGRKQRNP
jgi:hypothetical protein